MAQAPRQLPIAPHAARGHQLRKAQVGDHVHCQECREGEDRRRGEARPQHEHQHARGAKRMQQDYQQPLPDVSTVRECAHQGREAGEERVHHREHRHRHPEAGHGDMIRPPGALVL